MARTLPDRFHVRSSRTAPTRSPCTPGRSPTRCRSGWPTSTSSRRSRSTTQDLPPIDDSLRWLVDYDRGRATSAWPSPCRCRSPGQNIERGRSSTASARRSIRGRRRGPARAAPARAPLHRRSRVRRPRARRPTTPTRPQPEWSRRTPPGPPTLTGADGPPPGANGAVTAAALGIDPALLATLPAPTTPSRPRRRAFNTALWTTTWGDAIEHADPAGTRRTATSGSTRPSIDAVRDHWIGNVRGRGPLPGAPARPPAVRRAADRRDRRSLAAARGGFAETRLVPFLARPPLDVGGRGQRGADGDGPARSTTALPEILGTDAVLRGLRVRTALSPDPVLQFAADPLRDGTPARRPAADRRRRSACSSGVGDDRRSRTTLLTGKKTRVARTPAGRRHRPRRSSTDCSRPIPARRRRRACCRCCSLHADASQAPTPAPEWRRRERWTASLRAAIAETTHGTSTASWSLGALEAVAGRGVRRRLVADAADQIERDGRPARRPQLADRHPLPGLAPPTAVEQLAGRRAERSRLRGAGRHARGRRAATPGPVGAADFRRRCETIAGIDRSSERRLLLAETLDCCSHRLDAWITSAASRRLAELRAAGRARDLLGAYGWLERHRPAARRPPHGQIDGTRRAARRRRRRLRARPGTDPRGDRRRAAQRPAHPPPRRPGARALTSTCRAPGSATRLRCSTACVAASPSARCSATGWNAGCTTARAAGWSSTGSSTSCGRWRRCAAGKLDRSRPAGRRRASRPPTSSTACKLLELPTATVIKAMDDGPTGLAGPAARAYITDWKQAGPRASEKAVLAAIAELQRTHDAVADLLLAESVHQVV